MVCGRSYHGGDQQPGCGREFDWSTARKYEVRIERQAPQADVGVLSRLRGRNAFHPFTGCCLCGSQCIAGPRFRCIHCPAYDVCGNCEPKLVDFHQADHVFEIVFESDFRCPWLPRGTRVTVVRCGNKLPQSLTRPLANGVELEGQVGKIVARRRPPLEGYSVELDLGQGMVELSAEHLEPIIASRQEAEALLTKTLEQDGEPEPMDSQQQDGTLPSDVEGSSDEGSESDVPFGRQGPPRFAPQNPYDFADDSPLSGEEMPAPARRHVRPPRPGAGAPAPRRTRAQQRHQGGYNGPPRAQHRPPIPQGSTNPEQVRATFANASTSASQRTSPYNW